MLYRIVYCSRSCIQGDAQRVAEEIESILAISRTNNAAANITGALLYSGNTFAQVLEGPEMAVDIAYAKIRFDTRHCNVITLQNSYQSERAFACWEMGFAQQNLTAEEIEKIDATEIAPDATHAAQHALP